MNKSSNIRIATAEYGNEGINQFSDDSIRRRIADFEEWFVHTNFGNGIVARSTYWPDAPETSRHMGVGKFEFIVRPNLPDLQGKRVLEIGCNAGVISIHIARLGAAEVIGVDCERSWPGWKQQAEFLKEVLEWRCKTKYNVSYLECDMVDLPRLGLGPFDIVLAMNCIYYIPEEEICRLFRHFASITACLLIQCNTRDQKAVGRRARPAFIRQAMVEAGFQRIRVAWPWDHPRKGLWPQKYCRPVVVGRRLL